MSSLVIGIGLLINDLGEVLIDLRTHDKKMGGLWEFPGGKQENGESIENTIERELIEELGIKVKVGSKLIEFDYIYNDKKHHFIAYICKSVSGKPQPLASLEIKWVHPSKLNNYRFPEANIILIDALKEYLLLYKHN